MRAIENKEKKQMALRLSSKLYDEIAKWAEDDFRSVNGQIEFLLTECVKARKKGKNITKFVDENEPASQKESE